MQVKISKESEYIGQRLDIASSKIVKASRSYVKFLINEGHLKVNGNKEKPSYQIAVDDEISIVIPEKEDFIDTSLMVPVLYGNDDYVIYDKPYGLAVHHPESKKPKKNVSLVDVVKRDFPATVSIDPERLGIVHRLDKNTSGVIVIALNRDMKDRLKEQFKKRIVKKHYKAIACGTVNPDEAIIDAPISRSASEKQKMSIAGEGEGRSAQTTYSVIGRYTDGQNKYTLLDVYPKTGRTHQIRVHLSSIGHPIVGDKLYGGDIRIAKRQLLHAYSLSFLYKEKEVIYTSSLPSDFETFLSGLKKIS